MKFTSNKTGFFEVRNDRRIKRFEFIEGTDYVVLDSYKELLIEQGFIKTKTKKKGD
jgi:hypothetical protein